MAEGALINVRVVPRASRDEVTGWEGGTLRVRLRAPPVEGRANDALRRLLASLLGLPLGDIEIIGGETARTKRVRIAGLSLDQVQEKLGMTAR